jgi:hypothetical protein
MCRILLSTLVLVAFVWGNCAFAQDSTSTMNGFLGIPFGVSPASVKKALSARAGAKFDQKNSTKDVLIYDDVTVGGRKTSFVKFQFYKDQFYAAIAYYRPTLEARTIELYDQIKSDINSKYYVSDKDIKSFDYPYEDGDGHEITALRVGKATIVSGWVFPQKDGKENSIYLRITDDLFVKLSYYCGVLSDQASREENQQNARDY